MSVASLAERPHDARSFDFFAANNADHHLLIISALQQKLGITLPTYNLYPIAPSDKEAWLWRHQATHQQMDAVLGIEPNDLQVLDLSNGQNVEMWIQWHFQEHYLAGQLLGIDG